MTTTSILSVENIEVIYEKVILAVKNISLEVKAGSIVALLGANGAGKSSTLKAISNIIQAERGEVANGQIYYQGKAITHSDPHQIVKAGLIQVLEGRHCFAHLSVEENLISGAFVRRPKDGVLKNDLEIIYHYFPRLRKLRKNLAGYTSGGEQQMIAIGRALMAKPILVLLDEPSMGLAPQIVEEIFEIVSQLNREEKVSFLLAEQNANISLRYAHYAYLLENGRIANEGEAKAFHATELLEASYLGG